MNEQSQFKREIAIIPTWARVLAVIGFVLVQICLLVLLPHFADHMHGDMPPRGIMPFISVLGGAFFAIFLLMIGYVNADSKRRGMNPTLWTLLVIFIPKAIGFLAYFLLRKPLLMPGSPTCPRCSAAVGPDFRFCPKCGYAFAPSCVNCGRDISRDFVCCPYCGKPTGMAAPVPSPQPS